jgi:YggT family protein
VLTVYLLLLIARAIMDLVLSVSRTFKPTGAMTLLFEVVYTLTDPPLKALRRVIPPLRLGGISLDLGFLLLFIVVRLLAIQAAKL